MPYANILDKKTGQTFKALDFGGPAVYKVNGVWVYGWTGATSVTFDGKVATLNPYNKTSVLEDRWEIVSHQDMGTINWRVTVKNHSTQEIKTGVYPFNLNGNVYELKDCQPGTWVMASCGGYKIESSWAGQLSHEIYRLKGVGEIVYKAYSSESRVNAFVFTAHSTSESQISLGYWVKTGSGYELYGNLQGGNDWMVLNPRLVPVKPGWEPMATMGPANYATAQAYYNEIIQKIDGYIYRFYCPNSGERFYGRVNAARCSFVKSEHYYGRSPSSSAYYYVRFNVVTLAISSPILSDEQASKLLDYFYPEG